MSLRTVEYPLIESHAAPSETRFLSAALAEPDLLIDGRDASESTTTVRMFRYQNPALVATLSAVADLMRSHSMQRVYCAGDRLIRQGQEAAGLFVIESGLVEIIDTASQTVIDHDTTGGILGELSLLTGHPCAADVVAKSEVVTQFLDVNAYADLCLEHPELEIQLGHIVSSRLGNHQHDALCGKKLGGYRINHCINRGGMGVIYHADRSSDGPVAVKMLMHKYIDDLSMHTRFDQEANFLRSLDHPNIVQLVDHFLAYRTRFLVLSLCTGSDLLAVLRRIGPLGEQDARAVLGQIASGLLAAHSAGITHRDLKPANVLVDACGRIRITDFGLSRLREIDVADGRIVGTPSYMAPELFLGRESGMTSDWYALGCMAYELITGRTLFQAQDTRHLFQQKKSLQTDDLFSPCHRTFDQRCESISDEYLALIRDTVAPMMVDRNLDLDRVAQWSQPVPQLLT